jgi:hypothetical protein
MACGSSSLRKASPPTQLSDSAITSVFVASPPFPYGQRTQYSHCQGGSSDTPQGLPQAISRFYSNPTPSMYLKRPPRSRKICVLGAKNAAPASILPILSGNFLHSPPAVLRKPLFSDSWAGSGQIGGLSPYLPRFFPPRYFFFFRLAAASRCRLLPAAVTGIIRHRWSNCFHNCSPGDFYWRGRQ